MVASGSAAASAAGARVLAEGGNAVDAAVAAAFVLSVVEPTMSGLGGRTQILISRPDGTLRAIDGGTSVPAGFPRGRAQPEGYRSVGVPGTPAALARALEEHGTWPLARALEPAIALAANGFPLPRAEAERIASVAPELRKSRSARRYFLRPNGRALPPGASFVQLDLAQTLRRIAEHGVEDFYRGDIARRMARDIEAGGGSLRMRDLEEYRARDAVVVRGRYRGFDLVGSHSPASGATTIEVMQILEHFDLPQVVGAPDWVAIVAQALRIGFADRPAGGRADPESAQTLTSPELARVRASQIRAPRYLRVADRSRGAQPADSRTVDSSDESREPPEPDNTTHLSVVDGDGMAVSLTQSLGPVLGAGVAAEGLGFAYGATMGYLTPARPGARPGSSESPMILLKDGRVVGVIGGAGGRRIISSVVAVLSRVLDGKAKLPDAVRAPRLHVSPTRVEMEAHRMARWTSREAREVARLGFQVRMRDEAPYFGRVNAVTYDEATGEWVGAADPRWPGGAAVGAQPPSPTPSPVTPRPPPSRGF